MTYLPQIMSSTCMYIMQIEAAKNIKIRLKDWTTFI